MCSVYVGVLSCAIWNHYARGGVFYNTKQACKPFKKGNIWKEYAVGIILKINAVCLRYRNEIEAKHYINVFVPAGCPKKEYSGWFIMLLNEWSYSTEINCIG